MSDDDKSADIGHYKLLQGYDAKRANTLIAEAWQETLKSSKQRQLIAKALQVTPETLEGTKPPFQIKAEAGLEPGTVIFVGHLVLTYVVGPVAVGLAKDVVKEGLISAWKIIYSAIRAKKEGVLEE